MLYGYARVSTDGQDVAAQVSALRRHGVRRIVTEVRSGARERPELDALLQRLGPGDVLVFYKLDRLARSLVDLLRIVRVLEAAGAAFRSLTEPLETVSPAGRLLVQILGAVAEFELAVIRQRCEAGRREAVRRGVRFGRPREVDYAAVQAACRAGLGVCAAARRFKVAHATIRRALRSAP